MTTLLRGTIALLLCSLAGVLEDFWWGFEYFSFFREFLFFLGLLLLVTSIIFKRQILTFSLALISVIANGWFILPFWFPTSNVDAKKVGSEAVKVVLANINSRNGHKEKLISFLNEVDPDISLLIEISPQWKSSLNKISSNLPHAKLISLPSNFGMGIFSKSKIESHQTYLDRENMIPAMKAQIDLKKINQLTVFLIHPMPSLGGYAKMIRERYLKTISIEIRDTPGPVLVCGDFNITPWSNSFKRFLVESNLSIKNGFELIRTWPSTPLIPKLPIDICLGRSISIKKHFRGRSIGSDHYPLVVTVEIP